MQGSSLTRTLLWYHLPSLLVLAVGLFLSVTAFQSVKEAENRYTSQAFERAAANHAMALEHEVDRYAEVLQSTGALFDSSSGIVSRAQFHTFAQRLLPTTPAVQALEWIPRVPATSRAAYEASARASFPRFEIMERGKPGQMMPAGPRDAYFPVYYVEPYAGNEAALGFDLASDPARQEALLHSATSGQLAATAAITLVQEKSGQHGFLMFYPVYRDGVRPATPKTDDLLGFVLGVFRIGDVVEQALQPRPAAGIDISLYDDAAPPEVRRLYVHNSRTRKSGTSPAPTFADQPNEGLRYATEFDVGGRHWSIIMTPAPGQYSLAASSRAGGRLLMGIVFTLALVALLQLARRHAQALSRLNQELGASQESVTARAAELAESNRALQSEILARQRNQEELRRIMRARAVMSSCNHILVHATSESELLRDMCRAATDQGGYRMAWIGYAEHDEAKTVTPVAVAGYDDGYLDTGRRHWSEASPRSGAAGTVIRSGQAMMVRDILKDPQPNPWREEAVKRGYASLVCLPLQDTNDAAFGALTIYAAEADAFDRAEVELLTELANDIAFGILSLRSTAERKLAEASLLQERRLLHSLMDNIPDVIYFKDIDLRYLRINRALASRYQLTSPDEAVGRTRRDFVQQGEMALKVEQHEKEILRTGVAVIDLAYKYDLSDGTTLWFSRTEVPIRDEQGNITGLVGISRDITQRMAAEQRIERLNRVYAVLSGINGLVVRIRDRDELYRETCRIAFDAGGFTSAYLAMLDPDTASLKLVASSSTDPRHVDTLHAALADNSPELRDYAVQVVQQHRPLVLNDLEHVPPSFKNLMLSDGAHSLIVLPLVAAGQMFGIFGLRSSEPDFFDADEMKLLVELAGDIAFALDHLGKVDRLDYLANYDQITGLANRTLLNDRLRQAIAHARRHHRNIAVLYLDLDQFKFINDSFGHGVGDELLKQLAARLKSCVRESDTVAHLGADEFVVVLSDQADVGEIARVAERIRESVFSYPRITEILRNIMGAVSQQTIIADHEISVTCSIGLSLYPQDGQDADTLLKNADTAMYRAKELGRNNFQFYTTELNERMAERVSLQGMLKLAVERHEFALHYQPKLDLKSGRLSGMEALLRWNSPERGLIPPYQFIPILEETGMIVEVGRWVATQAMADYRQWRAEGREPARIAVNVSQIQLDQQNFVALVEEIIGSDRGGAAGLDLEITESLIMTNVETNIPKLKAIKNMGIRIAIDDFGTGYSSLSYLAKLPTDALKIDRAFIINITTNADDLIIVSAIISLAHSLKIKVIAEGVETEEQAKLLRQLDCDEIQGYLTSPALPAKDFWEWYEAFVKRTWC